MVEKRSMPIALDGILFKKDDKYIVKNLIKIRDNKNSSETTIKIANKLIGDTKLRKKLRVITSENNNRSIACMYMSNIICGRNLPIDFKFHYEPSILVKRDRFDDVIDELNYIKNNKDTIVIYFTDEEK